MDKLTIQYCKERLQESVIAIIFLLALFGAIIYAIVSDTSKVIESEIVVGELISFHQIQGNDGAIDSVFIIRLEDDSVVRVTPPSHTPIKINLKVELEKRTKESGGAQYYFVRYHSGS